MYLSLAARRLFEECQAAYNGIDSRSRGVKVRAAVASPGYRSRGTFRLCDPAGRSRRAVDRCRPMARWLCDAWRSSRRFGDARIERRDDRASGRRVQPTNGQSSKAARDLDAAADSAKRTGRWLRRPCPRTGPGYWITTVPVRIATVVGGSIVAGSQDWIAVSKAGDSEVDYVCYRPRNLERQSRQCLSWYRQVGEAGQNNGLSFRTRLSGVRNLPSLRFH